MKGRYLFVMAAGLLAGALVAAGLLYVNPLTATASGELGRFDRSLRYDFPADDVLILTHADSAGLPTVPADVTALWESSVRSTVNALIALAEGDGAPEALASKIMVPSARTELLDAGVVVDDHWLVTVPGQGSLFVLGHSNVWPAIRENVLPVQLLGRPWSGPRSYRTTQGPGLRGTALVVGATGRFRSQQGSAVERFELNAFSRGSGVESFAGELHLRLVDAEDSDEASSTGD